MTPHGPDTTTYEVTKFTASDDSLIGEVGFEGKGKVTNNLLFWGFHYIARKEILYSFHSLSNLMEFEAKETI